MNKIELSLSRYRKVGIEISIFCFILFCISPARATDLSSSSLDTDLTSGKTIVIGKVIEESDGNRYLILQKQWTLSPLRIFLPQKAWFGGRSKPRGQIGVLNLFSAINETNSKGELELGLFKIISVKSDYAKKTIDKLALRNDFVGEINPSWQFCEVDSECIQLKNTCGISVGVNKKYDRDYLNFLQSKKNKVNCAKVETSKVNVSKCVDNFCF